MTFSDKTVAKRRWRAMLYSLLAIIALAMILPSLGYVAAWAQSGPMVIGYESRDSNPRADMWRDARQSVAGTTDQSGPYTTNVLINNSGEIWREIRSGREGVPSPLKRFGGWIMLLSLAAIAVFFAVFGRNKIEGGREGLTVPRWTMYERVLHWFVAITFIVLGITGLSLLFGRTVLIPVLGARGFAAYAQVAMTVHNFVGPAFGVALVLMIISWLGVNIPKRVDLEWLTTFGGYFGGGHAPSEKLNGGEKLWYWIGVVGLGLAVVITGFILDFPNFGQDRATMALAHVIHAGAAMFWIALFFGHAYMGTLGTEGALEGMTTGRVDTAWAKQHHNLWYAQLLEQGVKPMPAEPPRGGPPPSAKSVTGSST